MLERSEVTIGLAGKYVDTYAFADGGLEVRWQGCQRRRNFGATGRASIPH
jgi:hypothetical protein